MNFLKVVPAPVYHINCMVKVMSALIVSFFNDYYNSRLSFCKGGGLQEVYATCPYIKIALTMRG